MDVCGCGKVISKLFCCSLVVPQTHLSYVMVLSWCCHPFSTLARPSVIQINIPVPCPQPMDNTGHASNLSATVLMVAPSSNIWMALTTSCSFKCHLAHQNVPNSQNRSKKTRFRCILIEFLYAHDRSVTLIWLWFWGSGNTKHNWENSFWTNKSVLLEQPHKIHHSKIQYSPFMHNPPLFQKNAWKLCSLKFLSSVLWHSNAYTRKQCVYMFVYD